MDVFAICILIFSFILLIGIGTPIAWSIALSSLFSLIVNLPNISSFTTIAQRMATGLDSFSLLAIPFFILSGQLMTHGGIAKQPTYLVGEGKQNEAVVPLPDNKSIPVDLGKNTGNQNNTNITVNMADGSSEMTTDGGAELAKAIDAAVQTTIEKELRPGGVLAGG